MRDRVPDHLPVVYRVPNPGAVMLAAVLSVVILATIPLSWWLGATVGLLWLAGVVGLVVWLVVQIRRASIDQRADILARHRGR